jgi:tRNA threonylcarbamoyladenosine biosynthesis protein TsaE
MKKIFYTKSEIENVVSNLTDSFFDKQVICFQGPMGSGKTTLIKAIVKQLGGMHQASSPSFGIVNEYHFSDGRILGYHFDFYRINDPTEALDLGLEDYLNQDVWIFIEWPEKVVEFLPKRCQHLTLKVIDPITRELSFEL